MNADSEDDDSEHVKDETKHTERTAANASKCSNKDAKNEENISKDKDINIVSIDA